MQLLWRLRSLMTPRSRRLLRQLSDPWIRPVGSIVGVRTSDPVVGLTFDDGPDPVSTPAILDVLANYRARATFFVLTQRAAANPILIRRMQEEGHSIGLHGVDHHRLTRMSGREARDHIRLGRDQFTSITGSPPIWFRPPYGSQSMATFLAARSCGMEVVAWSSDCADWTDRAESAISTDAVESVSPGSILLLHDTLAAGPDEVLPDVGIDRPMLIGLILKGLRSRGLSSLSIEGLLASGHAHRTGWFRP